MACSGAMLETPDPRSETRAFCQQIVTDVALARGSGDLGARVATLHTAVLAYPAYPDGEDTPLEGWLRELQELAQATGSRELAALVVGRRVVLHVRAARLSAAWRTLDTLPAELPESARRLADVGRAHLQIAEGQEVDRARLEAIAAGDDEVAAICARLALAELAGWDGPSAAVAAWQEVLTQIPGAMLDARLCALEHLLIHDVEQRGFLLRLVAEIHLGSGRGDPVITLAERYPGQVEPALIEEARELLAARVRAAASAKQGKPQAEAANKKGVKRASPGKPVDITAALLEVMGPPGGPPKVEGLSLAAKLGLAALIVCGVGLVVWLGYF